MPKDFSRQSHLKTAQKILVTRPTFIQQVLTFRNLLVVLIVSFTVLSVLAKQYAYFKFDLVATLFVQSYHGIWFAYLMQFLTSFNNAQIIFPITVLVCLYGLAIRKYRSSLILFISAVGSSALSVILKDIVQRPRPSPLLINQIGHFIRSDSFPSGHVLSVLGFYGFLFYLVFTQIKKGLLRTVLLILFGLQISLIGLSRMYLGAHWFSDVLGAYLIGFIWLSLMVYLHNKLNPKVKPG